MTDLSKNILKSIKEKGVSPKPRWQFLFKRATVWTIFTISIVLGSIAFGVIILQFMYADWDVQERLGRGGIGFLLLVIPYFWLIFFTAFSALAYHYFRLTKGGYKYSATLVVLGSLILSFIGGAVIYGTGLSDRMERTFQENISFYEQLHRPRHQIWTAPEKGLLGGRVIEIIPFEQIVIIDLQSNNWQVDIRETQIPPVLQMHLNLMIKILGEQIGPEQFKADEIRPWLPPRIKDLMRDRNDRRGPNNK